MKILNRWWFFVGFAAMVSPLLKADGLDAATQGKIDHWMAEAKVWAATPVLVRAVAAQNLSTPAAYLAMTQAKWAELADLDPFVRAFEKNAAGQFLLSKKTDAVTEAFVSDANGLKIAFLGKTTNWSHQGKPKHDVPMSGKTWQGKLEMDTSAATRQVQISVPVLEDGKPIGSLVVGLSLSGLTSD